MPEGAKHVEGFRDKHAKPGEEVLAWGSGYIGEMGGTGDKKQHNGALIVTQERVVFYRKGMFGEVLETMPLYKITSIERKSLLGHRVIRLHTSHDDLAFKTFDKAQEQALLDAIEKGRQSSQGEPQQTIAHESSLDKLKKLADLKEAGIVTEQEFEEKKSKLLEEI